MQEDHVVLNLYDDVELFNKLNIKEVFKICGEYSLTDIIKYVSGRFEDEIQELKSRIEQLESISKEQLENEDVYIKN